VERGNRSIDLDSTAWRAANRLLGALSRIELSMLRLSRLLKRAVVGERKVALAAPLTRLIRAPFHLCVALTNRLSFRTGNHGSPERTNYRP
jgi:hypothetical protein